VELTIAHPDTRSNLATAVVILGGPALFLSGHTLFKLGFSGHLARSCLVVIGYLAALIPVAAASPVLITSAVSFGVAALLAARHTYVRCASASKN
jgi:low temperature requirement protein LtrA